jgi:hypothetical protein
MERDLSKERRMQQENQNMTAVHYINNAAVTAAAARASQALAPATVGRELKAKDPTAAKRARDYRARKRAAVVDDGVPRLPPTVTEDRDGVTESVRPTVTTVTRERDDRDANRDAALQKARSNAVSDRVTVRPEVDLVALRLDIQEWARLHRQVEQLKVRQRRNERRGRVSDPVSRFVCLGIGVAFFALLAYSAAVPA